MINKNMNSTEDMTLTRKYAVLSICVYLFVIISLVLGLRLPSDKTYLEYIFSVFKLPIFFNGLYIPALQIFGSIILGWIALKLIHKDRLTLWKNGLLLVIVVVIVLWKLILY